MELEKADVDRRDVEAILWRDDDPISKVQQLVDLGMTEEDADDIVERYQIGQSAVVYYEQLPMPQRDL